MLYTPLYFACCYGITCLQQTDLNKISATKMCTNDEQVRKGTLTVSLLFDFNLQRALCIKRKNFVKHPYFVLVPCTFFLHMCVFVSFLPIRLIYNNAF